MFLPAARALARNLGSTTACILTLASGIAIATLMFTLIQSLLLRPLPFPRPDTLFALKSQDEKAQAKGVSWQDMRDLLAVSKNLSAGAVYRGRTWGFTDSSDAPVEVVSSGMVTHGFFDTLEVAVESGTGFSAEMERQGSNRVLWLTHSFWKRRYQGNPEAIGAQVFLNSEPYTIAGVLPASFHFPIEGGTPEMFIPLDVKDYCCSRDGRSLDAVCRLRTGVSAQAAQEEISALSKHLGEEYSATNRGMVFHLEDLQTALAGDRKRPLLLLGFAAALLMLVAAVNASGILLARTARNLREAAIKASLGAGFAKLAGEQLAQGALIAAASSLAGFVMAAAGLRIATLVPQFARALEGYSRIAEVRIDTGVFLFALIAATLTSLVAVLSPVLLMRPASLDRAIRYGMGASASRGAIRSRAAMVVAQMAVTTLLLCAGAGLFHQLRETLRAEKGFRTDQILRAAIGIPEARYDTDAKMTGFHERVIQNLRVIPGVQAAAGGTGVPISGNRTRFLLEGQDIPLRDRPRVSVGVASPGLFSLLDIAVVQGRDFTDQDRLDHPLAAIVNEAFVTQYLGGRKDIGARLRVNFWNGGMKPWSQFEIIGVIAGWRNRGLEAPSEPAIYLSSLQVPLEGFVYFARTTRPAAGMVTDFRKAVWGVDPNIQRITPRPLGQYLEEGLDSRRLAIWLIGVFGAIALFLATAGLGASISAGVTESRKEIAIRSALGETRHQVVVRVISRGLQLTGAGLACGIGSSLVVSHLVESQFAGTSWDSPIPATLVTILIGLATLGACAAPAYRAACLDPMEVLRRD